MLGLKEKCKGKRKCKNQLIYGISVDIKEELVHQEQFVRGETSPFYHETSLFHSRSPSPRILP